MSLEKPRIEVFIFHTFVCKVDLQFGGKLMHLSMLSRWVGRPGIGGRFDSSHRPVVVTFDRFNGLSRNILLTLVAVLTTHKCPGVGHLNRNSQLSSNAPPIPVPPPSPSSLTLIGALDTYVKIPNQTD